MSKHVEREISKRAAELYDLALDSGGHFVISELADELTEILLAALDEGTSTARDLIASAAQSAIRSVDKERRNSAPGAMLFELMSQPVAVDQSRRIARRWMREEDWRSHLINVDENAARVHTAAAKEHDRHSALAPYLATGEDTESAAASWQAAHPGHVLP